MMRGHGPVDNHPRNIARGCNDSIGDNMRLEPVRECDLPANALSQRHRASGDYTDCFCTKIARAVSHAEFVEAFYSTWLFRLERRILARFAARPSTDSEARALALGQVDRFAAWTVEQRAPEQVLLRDFTGRTCSWLMAKAALEPGSTLLYFGSVVTSVRDARTGRPSLGPVHGKLIGFHRMYSRMLLRAAARKLASGTAS